MESLHAKVSVVVASLFVGEWNLGARTVFTELFCQHYVNTPIEETIVYVSVCACKCVRRCKIIDFTYPLRRIRRIE